MMKKLRLLCAISCCAMLVFLQGCSFSSLISERLKLLEKVTIREEKENLQTSKDVLDCFSNDDAQSLRSLLCLKTQGLSDIDEQISAGFDFFKGKVISFDDKDMSGSEDRSIEYGETTFLERAWSIKNIKTDATDEIFEFIIRDFYICEDDKEREGIAQITIKGRPGHELVIGYRWPSYDSEGRDMSLQIIKLFDAKDMDGLKAMLCATTLGIADIDKQIQEGFDFYKGKSIDDIVGKDNGHNIHDGRLDWHASVSDDETISNGRPTSTSIDAQIDNIITDTGEHYKITFYANLLNKSDENSVGISQIIITSDDGCEQIIGERLE